MSLNFTGPGGSFEQRWISYALLRDCVQHYLEGGVPSGRFPALHQIAEALGRRTLVPAPALHAELGRLWPALARRPVADLAISFRTHSILSASLPPPERLGTMLLTDWGGGVDLPAAEPKLLGDVFGSLVEHLLRITRDAPPGSEVEVLDL